MSVVRPLTDFMARVTCPVTYCMLHITCFTLHLRTACESEFCLCIVQAVASCSIFLLKSLRVEPACAYFNCNCMLRLSLQASSVCCIWCMRRLSVYMLWPIGAASTSRTCTGALNGTERHPPATSATRMTSLSRRDELEKMLLVQL